MDMWRYRIENMWTVQISTEADAVSAAAVPCHPLWKSQFGHTVEDKKSLGEETAIFWWI